MDSDSAVTVIEADIPAHMRCGGAKTIEVVLTSEVTEVKTSEDGEPSSKSSSRQKFWRKIGRNSFLLR